MSTASVLRRLPLRATRLDGLRDLRARGTRDSVVWALGAVAVAIAIGAVSALGPAAVIPLAIALIVPAVITLWGATMTDILIASIFLEVVSFGGLTLSRLLAPIAVVIVAMALIRGRVNFHPGPILVPMAAYVTWATASGIWSVSLPHTIEILGSLGIALVYMVSFATLVHDERDLKRALNVLAVASIIIGLVSTLSFAGIGVFAGDSLQGGRSQGGVGDPNFFANVQLVALPLMLLLATEAKTWLGRAFFGLATLMAITSILSTLSRGGMIALVVVFLILPCLPAAWYLGSKRQKTAVMIALVVCVGGLFTRPGFRAEIVNRVNTLFASSNAAESGGSSAGSGRTELWKAAFASIEERPIFGLGLGAYPSQSNRLLFETPGVNLELFSVDKHPDGIEVHSAYIGTTVDLGFIGLAFFLSMLTATMLWLGRLASRARDVGAIFLGRVAVALNLSMVGWVISSTFIETETARPLWIIMGLTLAIGKIVQRHESAARAGQRSDAVAAFAPANDNSEPAQG
jgi:O-antigen ligase